MLSRATFNNLVTVLKLVVQGLDASYVANTTSGQQSVSSTGGGGMASAFLLLEVLHTHYTQSGAQSTASLSAAASRAGSVSSSTSSRHMALPLAPTPGGGSLQSSARSSHTVSTRHDAAGALGAPDAEASRRGSSSPMAPSEPLPGRQNSLSKPSGGAEGSNLVSTFGTALAFHCELFSVPGWLVLVFLKTNPHFILE